MTICHSHREKDPFVRFKKSIVFDSSISLKAKGLLSIAFSRPDDWTFYKSEMMKHCTDGEKSFNSGVKELEEAGYLHRTTKHEDKTGQLQGWEWHFFENPISLEEFKKRYRNIPNGVDAETPLSAKGSPNKKDSLSKNEENNNRAAPSPPASPPHAESVVVFSCLRDLPINQSLKSRLAKDFSEDQLQQAVQEYEDSDADITNVFGWLVASINNGGYVKSATCEEKVKENKLWAQGALKDFDDKTIGRYHCQVLGKHVEFYTVGGVSTPIVFNYDDSSFKSKLTTFWNSLRGMKNN